MQHNSALLLLSILVTGCANTRVEHIQWEIGERLPAIQQQPNIGVAGPVTGILNSQLFIAAGANFPDGMPWEGGKKQYQKTAYLFDINAGNLSYNKQFILEKPIAYPANISNEGYLYSAGGEDENGAVKSVYRYQIDKKGNLDIQELPPLPVALTNAGLVYANQALYLIGGENSEFVSDKVYKLDLTNQTGNWSEFMTLTQPVCHAIVVSDRKEKIYIAGGRKRNLNQKSDIYDQVIELDLVSKEQKIIAKLKQALAAGTGIYYQNQLIIIGGDNASTFHRVEEYIAEINHSDDPSEKQQKTKHKNLLQSNHPGFTQQVWALNLEDYSWNLLNSLIMQSPVTTTALLQDNTIIIPSGEVKAGVRTSQIITGHINKK